MRAGIAFPLFVPADQPGRFAKAAASGAEAVIIDLEDAVSPDAKVHARTQLVRRFGDAAGVLRLVRINAAGTPWHADDLTATAMLPVDGIMLPKAEDPETLRHIGAVLGPTRHLIALVESAKGIAAAGALAAHCTQFAFGSIDFAVDVGCAHERDALLFPRSALIMASRAGGLPSPLDGVTARLDDPAAVEDDAAYAARLGFDGKLLIHPSQVEPARRGFQPSWEEIAWARTIMAEVATGAAKLVGGMVDRPVRLRAERILSRTNGEGREPA